MEKEIPKVVGAKVLPNNYLLLDFEDGVQRYLPSHFLTQYVGVWDGSNEQNKGTKRTIVVNPSLTFLGNEFEITSAGTLVMNGQDKYTSEELWENSVEHIYSTQKRSVEVKNWKRNAIIPFVLFLLVLLLFYILSGNQL